MYWRTWPPVGQDYDINQRWRLWDFVQLFSQLLPGTDFTMAGLNHPSSSTNWAWFTSLVSLCQLSPRNRSFDVLYAITSCHKKKNLCGSPHWVLTVGNVVLLSLNQTFMTRQNHVLLPIGLCLSQAFQLIKHASTTTQSAVPRRLLVPRDCAGSQGFHLAVSNEVRTCVLTDGRWTTNP